MSAVATIPLPPITFIYPHSRAFPFDEMCEQIVRELEKRNWNVPGIEVKFDVYGQGESKFRRVEKIHGPSFVLTFGRDQGMLNRNYIDSAAVNNLKIPERELTVYGDRSMPQYKVQVGGEWRESRNFLARDVFDEFFQYLAEHVLPMITSSPVAAEIVDIFPVPAPIPWPASIGPLFAFGNYNNFEIIQAGQQAPSTLEPWERRVFFGSGYFLAPIGTKGLNSDFAFESLQWIGTGEVAGSTAIESLEIPGHHRWSDTDRFVYRVIPNRANDIYVADHGQYEKRRAEVLKSVPAESKTFTQAQIDSFYAARANTLIPVTEYKGGFEQPVVLIGRELGFDEVEYVSGPHEKR